MINNVVLVGRLTADPELKKTQNDVAVVTFTVAANRKFKNAQGEYETDYINCVAWRKSAELLAQYFAKGDRIGVTGSLQSRSYEDKAGIRRYITEVVVDNISFIDSKSERHQRSDQGDRGEDTVPDDTSLPFDM